VRASWVRVWESRGTGYKRGEVEIFQGWMDRASKTSCCKEFEQMPRPKKNPAAVTKITIKMKRGWMVPCMYVLGKTSQLWGDAER
jgi:hypothetical protein